MGLVCMAIFRLLMLILAISDSIAVVVTDSVQSSNGRYSSFFSVLEWFFTIFFTLEHIEGHMASAEFCFNCGAKLPLYQHEDVDAKVNPGVASSGGV